MNSTLFRPTKGSVPSTKRTKPSYNSLSEDLANEEKHFMSSNKQLTRNINSIKTANLKLDQAIRDRNSSIKEFKNDIKKLGLQLINSNRTIERAEKLYRKYIRIQKLGSSPESLRKSSEADEETINGIKQQAFELKQHLESREKHLKRMKISEENIQKLEKIYIDYKQYQQCLNSSINIESYKNNPSTSLEIKKLDRKIRKLEKNLNENSHKGTENYVHDFEANIEILERILSHNNSKIAESKPEILNLVLSVDKNKNDEPIITSKPNEAYNKDKKILSISYADDICHSVDFIETSSSNKDQMSRKNRSIACIVRKNLSETINRAFLPLIIEEGHYICKVFEDTDIEIIRGSSSSSWTRSLVIRAINNHLDKTRLQVELADLSIQYERIIDEIEAKMYEFDNTQKKMDRLSNFCSHFSITQKINDIIPKGTAESQTDIKSYDLDQMQSRIRDNTIVATEVSLLEQRMNMMAYQKELLQNNIEHLSIQLGSKDQLIFELKTRLHSIQNQEQSVRVVQLQRENERFSSAILSRKEVLNKLMSQIDESQKQNSMIKAKVKDLKCVKEILHKRIIEENKISQPDVKALCQLLESNRKYVQTKKAENEVLEFESKFIMAQKERLCKSLDENSIADLDSRIEMTKVKVYQKKNQYLSPLRADSSKNHVTITNQDDFNMMKVLIDQGNLSFMTLRGKESILKTKARRNMKKLMTMGIPLPVFRPVEDEK